MKAKKNNKLADLKDKLLDYALSINPATPEYKETMQLLTELDAIESKTRRSPFSWDTLLLGLFNILGIFVIVAYEQKHVFVSKALTFIRKAQ